jgi:hypothetical protein
VDDKGVSRNLPLNERVTSLIQTAGYDGQRFMGDAFFGKVFDDQDAWDRIDFGLNEFSSDAAWLAVRDMILR